jgi:hypothetical protein
MEVAEPRRCEFTDPTAGGIEHQEREPVRRREQTCDGLHVPSGRRLRLLRLLPRQPNLDAIARRLT